MSINPGISVVISFAGFLWIFMKKVYPFLVNKIDDYINAVKDRIQKAENLKTESYASLKNALIRKDDTAEVIRLNEMRSKEKIKKIHQENDDYLTLLRERHEIALKAQLEAELGKQKNELIKQLADSIVKELAEKVSEDSCKTTIATDKKDLYKLLGSHR